MKNGTLKQLGINIGHSVGYVSVSNSTTVNMKHNKRDPEYMDLEEAAYYSREQKRILDGTYPPDYEIPPFRIDRSKSHLNEILYEKSLEEVYEENFQPAADAFDKKQRHKERRKGNYLEYVKSLQDKKVDGKHLKSIPKVAYELVFQIGGSEDSVDPETGKPNEKYHALTDEEKQIAAEALKDFFKDFQKRNPEIAVVGAYLHLDETSPHLHVTYVPICHSKRGMSVKNSRAGALDEQEQRILDSMEEGEAKEKFKKEMSVDSFHFHRVSRWQERERIALRECAFEHGLTVETTRKPTKETHANIAAFSAKKRKEAILRGNSNLLDQTKEIALTMQEMEDRNEELKAENEAIKTENKQLKDKAQEEADTIIANAKQQAEDIVFPAYEERDEAIQARDEAIEQAKSIKVKDKSYAVDMFGNLKGFKESTYDEIIEKQNGYQTKAILDKKTIEKKTAENAALQAENKTLKTYQKAYTDIQKELPKRSDIDKALEDEYLTNKELSEMIKLYSLRLPASERKNIQRTLERLDKLDSYIVNSIRIRPTMETQERVETLWDYSDKMHDLYEKVLDFKGRGEIYEKLPKMWERIQKENDKYWKGIKGSHEGYINLNNHFIQSAGNSALQGIKELYAMQEQAQEEYER